MKRYFLILLFTVLVVVAVGSPLEAKENLENVRINRQAAPAKRTGTPEGAKTGSAQLGMGPNKKGFCDDNDCSYKCIDNEWSTGKCCNR